MKKTRIIAFAITLSMAFTLAACNNGNPANNTPTQPSPSESSQAPNPASTPSESPQVSDATTSIVAPSISNLLIIDEFEPIEENALVYLGMLRLDAWDTLLAHISQDDVQGGNAFYSSIDDGYHNEHEFEGFSYNTDKNDALYIVSASLERYQPASGLRFGDTFARVIELYGSGYIEYTEDGSGFSKYEYKIGNHFFSVSFVDGSAYAWRVSSYSEQVYRDAQIDNIKPGD